MSKQATINRCLELYEYYLNKNEICKAFKMKERAEKLLKENKIK